MEEYKKAIRIKPLLSEARCGLAAAYHRLGDRDSAIRELKEAIQMNPKDGTLHYNLGKIYDEAQKYELAKREYEKAIEISPKDYEAYHNIGKIHEAEGNTKKAVECYQRVIDLAPPQYASYVKQLAETIRRLTKGGPDTLEWEEYRNSIFERAYDQAISEYASWEKYKKEQWKSSLYYGEEDLLDLALCLLSSGRRVKYPIPALDLAAYTIKKFNLHIRLANTPVVGTRFNTLTNENDANQILSLKVKFGKISEWQLHFGAHILARCALLNDNPEGYFADLVQNMTPPHDIIVAAEKELRRIINHQCPYENEAEGYRTPRDEALTEAIDFFYEEKSPSPELRKEIEVEVRTEKIIAEGFRKGEI